MPRGKGPFQRNGESCTRTSPPGLNEARVQPTYVVEVVVAASAGVSRHEGLSPRGGRAHATAAVVVGAVREQRVVGAPRAAARSAVAEPAREMKRRCVGRQRRDSDGREVRPRRKRKRRVRRRRRRRRRANACTPAAPKYHRSPNAPWPTKVVRTRARRREFER